MNFNLRKKILLPVITLIILGMGISTCVSYFQSKTALEGEIKENLDQIGESTRSMLSSWISDRKLDISTWSEQELYRKATLQGILAKAARKSASKRMAGLKEAYGYYENLNVAEEVARQLEGIQQSSSKVATLIGEIAAASKEQAQRIEQVNAAVSEMDKVVQQNAADSEESASASEELSSQATDLNKMVAELSVLVDGQRDSTLQGLEATTRGRKSGPHRQEDKRKAAGKVQAASRPSKGKLDAEKVIPLDESDFRDF